MGSGYWIVGYRVQGEECFEKGTSGLWDQLEYGIRSI